MKKLLAVLYLALVGCDFTVPLDPIAGISIDRQAVGLWERTKTDGTTERLLVLPLNDHEYILSWPKGGSRELLAKAHLLEFSGQTLIQLQWLGTSDGEIVDDDRVYQIASYTIDNTSLGIRLLNPDIVGRDVSSSRALAEAITFHHENPALFRDQMLFKKSGS